MYSMVLAAALAGGSAAPAWHNYGNGVTNVAQYPTCYGSEAGRGLYCDGLRGPAGMPPGWGPYGPGGFGGMSPAYPPPSRLTPFNYGPSYDPFRYYAPARPAPWRHPGRTGAGRRPPCPRPARRAWNVGRGRPSPRRRPPSWSACRPRPT